jgi:predicted secreted protein
MYFDGTGDVIYTPQDTAFNIGTDDFTFEAWVYPTLYTSNNWNTLFAIGNTSNFGGLLVGKTDTGSFVIRQYGTANVVTTTNLPDLNAWTHIACVRSSGTSKLYYNGSEIATASDTTNYSSTTPFAHIGNSDHTTYSHYWNGYVSDARFISSTAVYSGAFTPPTGPLTTTGGTYSSTTNVNTSITASNTLLLIKGADASIIDKSQGTNLKLVGDTTGSTTQVKFAGSKSMYFDGSGDYVFVPASSFLDISSSDITIEGYFYTTSTSVKQGVWEFYSDDSNYARLFFEGGNGNVLRLTLNSAGTLRLNATGTTTLSINTWYHIAVTRDHSSGAWKTYIGGVQDTGASGTESAAVDTSLWNFEIGRDLAGTDRYWAGYIQDFRFTKGLARYTANFTPPILSLKG